jgi:hypothetical protein
VTDSAYRNIGFCVGHSLPFGHCLISFQQRIPSLRLLGVTIQARESSQHTFFILKYSLYRFPSRACPSCNAIYHEAFFPNNNVHLSIHLSIYPSIYLSIYQSFYLSIYLSMKGKRKMGLRSNIIRIIIITTTNSRH